MQLSLYEQYYVRKLLRRYIGQLNYPMSGVAIRAYFHSDLNQLLRRFGVNKHIVHDLRILIQLHQSTRENSASTSERCGLEHKILWLIGLKFLILVANTSTVVISESAATHFKFVLEGQLHHGIRYSGELYSLYLKFGAEPDFSASRLLMTLINRRLPFVLEASEQQHTIWISLRSPACQTFLSPAVFLPQMASNGLLGLAYSA
jgi:hypothetical protein